MRVEIVFQPSPPHPPKHFWNLKSIISTLSPSPPWQNKDKWRLQEKMKVSFLTKPHQSCKGRLGRTWAAMMKHSSLQSWNIYEWGNDTAFLQCSTGGKWNFKNTVMAKPSINYQKQAVMPVTMATVSPMYFAPLWLFVWLLLFPVAGCIFLSAKGAFVFSAAAWSMTDPMH